MTAIDTTSKDVGARLVSRQGPGRVLLRRFLRQGTARFGLTVLVVLFLAAIFAPLVAPYDPAAQDLARILEGPSAQHWLGTDDLGRDVLSRLIFGARISLGVSVGIVSIALSAALVLGLLAGYRGGRTDSVIMRGMDVLFAFPPLILALVVRSLLGPSLVNLMFAIAIVFVPSFVRLIRGQILSVREETYIEASRSIGTGGWMIVRRHVLPNIAGPVVVQGALALGFALLAEAGLSFLGFGAPPPSATWGTMLRRAFDFVLETPYQIFVPGGAITLAVLAYNFLGEGLNTALGRDGGATPVWQRSHLLRRGTGPSRQDRGSGDAPALVVSGLTVEVQRGPDDWVPVVRDVTFSVDQGMTLGIVGESGCGKTMTALSVLGLLPKGAARIAGGSISVHGRELVGLPASTLREIRGGDLAMIFQDPSTSLNPAFTVGNQIAEAVQAHGHSTRRAAWRRAIELLDRVGIPDATARVHSYPHELSGGMRQRAMIAMALAGNPSVLIADEPTTALDVTVQAEILELLQDLQAETGMAIVFVTHDLGVVAELCDDVVVMYAGEVVERGLVGRVFAEPQHPYTRALIDALPETTPRGEPLGTIPGRVPGPGSWPEGCHFADRCDFVEEACRQAPIASDVTTDGREVRCRRHTELDLETRIPA